MSFEFQQIDVRQPHFRLSCAPNVADRWGRWLRLLLCDLLRCHLLRCHLLPLGCVLMLGSSTAWAMGDIDAEVPAPMCGPDGASVPAGDDIPEIDRGHFEALPCEAQLWLASFGKSDGERGCPAVSASDTDPSAPCPSVRPPRPRYDGAYGGAVPFPGRAEPMLATFTGRDGLAPSRGHARALFRPPVTNA